MKKIWELTEISGNKNPVHTGGFLNGYDARAFTPEEVIAREAIQNSTDAGKRTEGLTEIVFQKLKLNKKSKTELCKLFNFQEILFDRKASFNKGPQNVSFSLQKNGCFSNHVSIFSLALFELHFVQAGTKLWRLLQPERYLGIM